MDRNIYTISNLNFVGSPTPVVEYVWKRSGVPISGADGISYETNELDNGNTLSVEITLNNMYGSTTKILSDFVDITEQETNFPDDSEEG